MHSPKLTDIAPARRPTLPKRKLIFLENPKCFFVLLPLVSGKVVTGFYIYIYNPYKSRLWVPKNIGEIHSLSGWWNIMSGWWFQILFNLFIFTPIWGRRTHFDEHIFQMGWFNHQLDFHLAKSNLSVPSFFRIKNTSPPTGTREVTPGNYDASRGFLEEVELGQAGMLNNLSR